MGLITGLYQQGLHNQTRCNKWYDIQESHMKKGNESVIELHDTQGMFLLLSMGLSAALITFILELLMHNTIRGVRKGDKITILQTVSLATAKAAGVADLRVGLNCETFRCLRSSTLGDNYMSTLNGQRKPFEDKQCKKCA